MATLHVLRVFLGPVGSGGNPLGVVLDGSSVPVGRRQAVAAELGFSETVFVDEVVAASAGQSEAGPRSAHARISIFTPATELAFAGHPSVGTSWLLRRTNRAVDRLIVRAGEIRTWSDGDVTWIRARPEWVHPIRMVEYATPGEVEELHGPQLGDPGVYAWAWEDAGIGVLRARYFATDIGIAEDEATGAAAVLMGARVGLPLTIRQGRGSVIQVRPGPGGTVEVGGRTALVGTRDLAVGAAER